MIIYAGKDYYDVSRKAANIMSAQIIMKPRAVLGLATGSTPIGMYKHGLTENTLIILSSDNGPVVDDGYIFARSAASSFEPSDEYMLGMEMPCTLAPPTASALTSLIAHF